MNPVAKLVGVEYLPGVVVNDNPDYPANYTMANVNKEFLNETQEGYSNVQMPTATSLGIIGDVGFQPSILLSANKEECWLDQESPDRFGEITYQPELGDKKSALPLAYLLERKINNRQQKVFIAGDAELLSNERLGEVPVGFFAVNSLLLPKLSSWFTNSGFPLDIPIKEDPGLRVKLAFENLFYVKLVYYFLVPGIFAAFGTIMLIKRMRN